jgi:hypothetical protein
MKWSAGEEVWVTVRAECALRLKEDAPAPGSAAGDLPEQADDAPPVAMRS